MIAELLRLEKGNPRTDTCDREASAANAADVNEIERLLQGEEDYVFADARCCGADKRPPGDLAHGHEAGPAQGHGRGALKALTRRAERLKAQVRARVEHPFDVVKNLFGHRKVRYKGLKKNTAHCFTLFALANLVIAKKRLLA